METLAWMDQTIQTTRMMTTMATTELSMSTDDQPGAQKASGHRNIELKTNRSSPNVKQTDE